MLAFVSLLSRPVIHYVLQDCDTLGCNDLETSGSLTRRGRLASEGPAPQVHIGTIGSASTVMKSGKHRDTVARKNNMIAYEMESAGASGNLSCFIIKGVCDHADSHRNKI